MILMERFHCGAKKIARVQVVVADEFPGCAVKLIGTRFARHIDNSRMEPVLGREEVSLHFEFLNFVDRNLESKVSGAVVSRFDAIDQIARGGFPVAAEVD